MRASAKLNNGPPSAQTRLGTASMAHLHSLGKGANKTPPDCVAFDLPQVGCDGPSAAARGFQWRFARMD
jgi:hypothetical protein